ncbi:TRAP transporter substrate-binding protein [Rhodobium gokarnense]|uniref:Tripartite ATP-independent transporter DctP family solute receptor n=1 Tax=Rhodobium gokarnense TaxID=364296 RepID=A0ABT3HF48_9HYPH|nr:TRAP transporter substrate-binding protein [Rhodobium gokarnense]MCW2308969.1 tripartite ATP-independent transporter DctP family solute receptor [Rhodobium gokarnense]
MKRTLIAACVLGIFAGVSVASADTITIATNGKPAQQKAISSVFMAMLIEQATHGKYTVKVAHSATLGDDRQMLKSVKAGSIEITVNSDGAVAEIVPQLNAFGLPYLFSSLPQAWEVLDGPTGDKIAALLDDKGYVVLAWFDNGIRKITHTSKPITSPADIKGMKIRTPPSQVTLDAFNAMGANPAPLAWSELPAALQSGVFEGQENPLANIYGARLHELTPYIARSNHKYEMTPVLASKAWWNSLSDADKDAIKSAATAASWYDRGSFVMKDEGLEATLKAEGAKFNDVDIDAFKEATASVYDKWEKEIGSIVPEIRAAAAEAGGK